MKPIESKKWIPQRRTSGPSIPPTAPLRPSEAVDSKLGTSPTRVRAAQAWMEPSVFERQSIERRSSTGSSGSMGSSPGK